MLSRYLEQNYNFGRWHFSKASFTFLSKFYYVKLNAVNNPKCEEGYAKKQLKGTVVCVRKDDASANDPWWEKQVHQECSGSSMELTSMGCSDICTEEHEACIRYNDTVFAPICIDTAYGKCQRDEKGCSFVCLKGIFDAPTGFLAGGGGVTILSRPVFTRIKALQIPNGVRSIDYYGDGSEAISFDSDSFRVSGRVDNV